MDYQAQWMAANVVENAFIAKLKTFGDKTEWNSRNPNLVVFGAWAVSVSFFLRWITLFAMLAPVCVAQSISGKWCGDYEAAARDGWFKECIVILKAGENLDSLRWVMAECRTCRTPSERKPYVFRLPSRVHGRNEADLLKQLDFEYLDGKLVAKGWASDGWDIVFERDQTYSPQPSFNCGKAQHPREKAICASPQLCLLDQELSLTFQRAKKCAPKLGLDGAQNAWWRDELSKCQSGECVPGAYSLRIRALRKACADEVNTYSAPIKQVK